MSNSNIQQKSIVLIHPLHFLIVLMHVDVGTLLRRATFNLRALSQIRPYHSTYPIPITATGVTRLFHTCIHNCLIVCAILQCTDHVLTSPFFFRRVAPPCVQPTKPSHKNSSTSSAVRTRVHLWHRRTGRARFLFARVGVIRYSTGINRHCNLRFRLCTLATRIEKVMDDDAIRYYAREMVKARLKKMDFVRNELQ